MTQLKVLGINCLYAEPSDSGQSNQVKCTAGIAINPPRIWCASSCPHRLTQEEVERAKNPSSFLTGKTQPTPSRKWGLGDIVEKGISLATFGQGKRLADKLARKQGKKGCGCQKRKEALNNLGKKVGL